MGNNSSGFRNEDEIIECLNDKKVSELNSNLKEFINFLFPNVNEGLRIRASSGKRGQKPDMIIDIDNEIKKVSIKKGSGNSVHQENVDVFIKFLSSINIPNDIINELLRFHWGDGTCDGTGTIRMSGKDYIREFANEIEKINEKFNQKDNLKHFINRFIIQGKSKEYDEIDSIYYGNACKGHWANRKEIMDYIINDKFKVNSIHFGPLTYQTWNRCVNFNPKTENRRKVMQIKWASLFSDLVAIERSRNNE